MSDIEIVYIDPTKLKPAEYNPRELTETQHTQLTDSIDKFGLVDPFVINKHKGRENIVIGGHQRLKIAKQLNIKKVPIVYVSLPEEKERELNIRFFEPEAGEGLTDDDEVPEIEEVTTKAGDLWILGEHRLLCGDATKKADVERLMDGEKADMVFTDPPFDLEDHGWLDNATNIPKIIFHSDKNISEITTLLKDEFSYYLVNYYSFGFALSGNMPQLAHKLIGIYGAKFDIQHDGFKTVICEQMERDRLSPYQKSIKLIMEIFNHYIFESCLDLFLGSGSTLIACEKTNRKCYGMEIDPHYCDVIVKRWEDYTGKEAELA